MFDCSGLTCSELAEKLANARASYEQLVLGGAVRVVVDQNGERVEFTAASAPRLSLYIQTLLSQMRLMQCPCVGPASQPQRAFKFIF